MKKNLIIYFLVLILLALSIPISKKYKEHQEYIKQQSIKRDIEDGIKRAEIENKKLEELKKYETPLPNSKRAGDSNEKSKDIRMDNAYFLFKSEYLSLDQFVNAEELINKGLNSFSQTPDDLTIEKLYGIKHDDYIKLKELVSKVGSISKVNIDESSIIKNENVINFKLNIAGGSQSISININMETNDTDNNIKIKWSI